MRKDTKETDIQKAVSKLGYDISKIKSYETNPRAGWVSFKNSNLKLIFFKDKKQVVGYL